MGVARPWHRRPRPRPTCASSSSAARNRSLSRYKRQLVVFNELKPLGKPDVVDYLRKRGIPDAEVETIARYLMAVHRGIPSQHRHHGGRSLGDSTAGADERVVRPPKAGARAAAGRRCRASACTTRQLGSRGRVAAASLRHSPPVQRRDSARSSNPALSAAAAAQAYERSATGFPRRPRADGSALHDDARRELFREWLKPENADELAVSADGSSIRLVAASTAVRRAARPAAAPGALPPAGVRREARRWPRSKLSATTIGGTFASLRSRRCSHWRASTTQSSLPSERLRLDYQAGRLALDRGDAAQAITVLGAVADDGSAPPQLAARARYRLGRAHVEERQWSAARRELARARAQLEALGVPPELPAVIRWLGVVERELRRLGKAESTVPQEHQGGETRSATATRLLPPTTRSAQRTATAASCSGQSSSSRRLVISCRTGRTTLRASTTTSAPPSWTAETSRRARSLH